MIQVLPSNTVQSPRGVEYTDCISTERLDPSIEGSEYIKPSDDEAPSPLLSGPLSNSNY